MSELASPPHLVPESACRTHPERTASLVCGRCGDFICPQCRRGGSGETLCPTCAERLGLAEQLPAGVSWGIGAVFAASLSAFRQTFVQGLGMGAISFVIFQLPLGIATGYFQGLPPSEQAALAQAMLSRPSLDLALLGVGGALFYMLGIWITMRTMSGQVLIAAGGFRGTRLGVSEAWEKTRGTVWALFTNLALLPGLVVAGVLCVGAVVAALFGVTGGAIVVIPVFALLGILMFIWFLRVFVLLPPLVALEGARGLAATARAWRLSRERTGDIFVIVLLYGVAIVILAIGFMLLSLAVAMVFTSPQAIFGQSASPPMAMTISSQVASSVLGLAFSHLSAALYVGIYYGLRSIEVWRASRSAVAPLPV